MTKVIYKENIEGILSELSDGNYQERVWVQASHEDGMTISFVESINMLFDDCLVGDYLAAGEILFDRKVTEALRELDKAQEAIDEFRPEEAIITDPLMESVRQKAATALALIEASDGRESTVEIITE